MSLGQVQIIQSLAQALSWYEREMEWGAAPQELRHLTGRIGELYVAMIERGTMAPDVNQRGYDVVSALNEQISVKTITTSTHITVNANTIEHVDRVIVVAFRNDEERGIELEIVYDQPTSQFQEDAQLRKDKYQLSTSRFLKRAPVRDLSDLNVRASAEYAPYLIRRYENSTLELLEDDTPISPTLPVLREIARKVGVEILNSNGNPKNTRTLGADIIKVLTT